MPLIVLLIFNIINYSNHLWGLAEPIVIGLLIILSLIVIIFLIYKRFNKLINNYETKSEDENLQLMSLFSEIDPDPILKVNDEGFIISANNTAKINFKGFDLIGSNFSDLVPNVRFSDFRTVDSKMVKISKRHFNVSIRKLDTVGISLVYFHNISDRIEVEKEVEKYKFNLKKLWTNLEDINENEKQRVGQELHDGIGQNISLLRIKVQNLSDNVEDNARKRELDYLLSDIDQLSQDVREISHHLRPRILNEFGLTAALSSMIESINKNSSIHGALSWNEDTTKITGHLEVNLFRICQESINNIVKHSNCTNFFIQFIVTGNDLKLIISDDGIGFNKIEKFQIKSPSLGLLNIKERIENMGGKIIIESSPNEGTTYFIYFYEIQEYFKDDSYTYS